MSVTSFILSIYIVSSLVVLYKCSSRASTLVPKFVPTTVNLCLMTGEALEGYTSVIIGIPSEEYSKFPDVSVSVSFPLNLT